MPNPRAIPTEPLTGPEDEIEMSACFLSRTKASYVTGNSLRPDGVLKATDRPFRHFAVTKSK